MYNVLQKDMKDVGFYLHTIHHQGPTAISRQVHRLFLPGAQRVARVAPQPLAGSSGIVANLAGG